MSEVFIDEFFSAFYEELGNSYKSTFLQGQIFWTYIYYNYENLELWRPSNSDETGTIVSEFRIESAGGNAFNRTAPLKIPPLESKEEFIVTRAKKRPAVLLNTPDPIITSKFSGSAKINKNIYFVAPLYSIIDKIDGKIKYDNEFVDRVRKLEYYHFGFVPTYSKYGIEDSILRLDSIQAILKSHLQPLAVKLSNPVFKVLQGQLIAYFTGDMKKGSDYYELREQLLNPD